MHEGNPVLNIQIGAMVHRRLVYIYLLNVPSFSSRYFNKIKRTSRLGRLLALSLEILSKLERIQSNVQQNMEQTQNPTMEATINSNIRITALE